MALPISGTSEMHGVFRILTQRNILPLFGKLHPIFQPENAVFGTFDVLLGLAQILQLSEAVRAHCVRKLQKR